MCAAQVCLFVDVSAAVCPVVRLCTMLRQCISQHGTQLLLMGDRTYQGSTGIQESLLQACRMVQTKHLMALVVHLARPNFCLGLQMVQSSGRPVCGHLSVLCHAAVPVTVSRAAHMPHKPLHHFRPSLLPQLPMLLETRLHHLPQLPMLMDTWLCHLPLHQQQQWLPAAPQAQKHLHQPRALCNLNYTCQTHLCQSPICHLQLPSAVRWVPLN